MSSADPSKIVVTADSSMNIELNRGSPNSRKGPQNHNENGDPGSPKFYDTGTILIVAMNMSVAKTTKKYGSSFTSFWKFHSDR